MYIHKKSIQDNTGLKKLDMEKFCIRFKKVEDDIPMHLFKSDSNE